MEIQIEPALMLQQTRQRVLPEYQSQEGVRWSFAGAGNESDLRFASHITFLTWNRLTETLFPDSVVLYAEK
jgi:hypothetical protein